MVGKGAIAANATLLRGDACGVLATDGPRSDPLRVPPRLSLDGRRMHRELPRADESRACTHKWIWSVCYRCGSWRCRSGSSSSLFSMLRSVSGRTDRRRRLTRGRRGGGDTLLAARDAGRVRHMPNLISSLIVFVGRGRRLPVAPFSQSSQACAVPVARNSAAIPVRRAGYDQFPSLRPV